MAIRFEKFTQMVEQAAPLACAYPWDNSGATVCLSDSVEKILVTLDVTEDVIRQAEEQGCDMILSHHPLIFREVKKLDYRHPITGLVLRAIRAGISLYAAHTSFDCAQDGLNFALADLLGLQEQQVFLPEESSVAGAGLGVLGRFPREMERTELTALMNTALKQQHPRHNGIDGHFSRAAVVSGAGGEFFREAKQAGAEVLITGEAKYNHFIDAAQMGILLIEAGHFETERVFIETMAAHLRKQVKEEGLAVQILCAEVHPPCIAV